MCQIKQWLLKDSTQNHTAQSVGAVEYTNYISAERRRLLTNECPGYDTKQTDGKAPVLDLWGK